MISLFTMHFFVTLAFSCSVSSSNLYAYALALSAQDSTMLFPPNSSLKNLLPFYFYLLQEVCYLFYHNSMYETISQHY